MICSKRAAESSHPAIESAPVVRTALRALRSGEHLSDKLEIAARLAVYTAFPVGSLARRLGHPLPDPTRLLGEVTVRGPGGVFVCPPGPGAFFLGVAEAYEPRLSALLQERWGTVVDVGANIGFITVRAARAARRVIAIEPHPVRFRYLKRNVALNGLTNVLCINCAVGRAEGEIGLYDVDPTLGPRPLDVSTTPGRGKCYHVPLRTLDSLVQEADLVKIDVEGYEAEVLRGATDLLASGPRLVIEALGGPATVAGLLDDYSLEELDTHTYLAIGKVPAKHDTP
jgi:FkbM family methyltransferase